VRINSPKQKRARLRTGQTIAKNLPAYSSEKYVLSCAGSTKQNDRNDKFSMLTVAGDHIHGNTAALAFNFSLFVMDWGLELQPTRPVPD
jgi:hypothetical protein